MMPVVVRQVVNGYSQFEFLEAGIVSESERGTLWSAASAADNATIETNQLQADSAVVTLAKESQLYPRPASEMVGYWHCPCPGRNHFMLLNTARNEFNCGCCKQGGEADARRSWVETQRGKKTCP